MPRRASSTRCASENEATTQLTDLQNQITQAQLETDVNTAGIIVLERASAASQGIIRTARLKLVFGAIAGFLVGVTIVIVRASRDRRVRLRDDIAAAAGAPVVASIATRRPRNTSDWLALLENYEPNADESWSLRRVLRGALAADGTPPVHLTVVTLPSDTDAVALGPQIAAFAAASGVETLLVIVGRDPAIASLRQACDDANGSPERTPWRGRQRRRAGRQVRANLSIVATMPSEFEDLTAPQLIVTAAVADVPTLDDDGHASIGLIGVTAGVATPERIAAAAAASVGRQPFAGVIIANPDPTTERRVAYTTTLARIRCRTASEAQEKAQRHEGWPWILRRSISICSRRATNSSAFRSSRASFAVTGWPSVPLRSREHSCCSPLVSSSPGRRSRTRRCCCSFLREQIRRRPSGRTSSCSGPAPSLKLQCRLSGSKPIRRFSARNMTGRSSATGS